MRFLEAAKKVMDSKTAHLIRPRKGADMEYDVKPIFTGSKRGWTLLDTFTASAVAKVAEALMPENRERLDHQPAGWVCKFALDHV